MVFCVYILAVLVRSVCQRFFKCFVLRSRVYRSVVFSNGCCIVALILHLMRLTGHLDTSFVNNRFATALALDKLCRQHVSLSTSLVDDKTKEH